MLDEALNTIISAILLGARAFNIFAEGLPFQHVLCFVFTQGRNTDVNEDNYKQNPRGFGFKELDEDFHGGISNATIS
ncbi:hypothetical protein EAW55_01495 [Legionella jordanis]|uniref:Uncharacterized protein n=1 Tax=Legionella jordanis TaxID=456 RepID=A0A0W0VED9_9GAMM|nr:hypothetical protein [Legionella jordanis]KTD18456.1 hypothetical protein Ljor_2762 [Legionella jordanis]RMX05361.1 hypothetical protein EAW55_01495 [Legionella jordanis]RMX20791.1 hypothetical protein EAS68_05570 [Legionella jordanis]VEH13196.1 Uncharacterised protein [Legionella jordanis]HAT8715028.1 hypothetical protein [Legionella jordanis]